MDEKNKQEIREVFKEVWEGNTGREYCDTIIDANSILSVADKLIKEL